MPNVHIIYTYTKTIRGQLQRLPLQTITCLLCNCTVPEKLSTKDKLNNVISINQFDCGIP